MSEHWGVSFVISVIVVVSLFKFICHPFSCFSRRSRYCNVHARYCHGQRGFAIMPNFQSDGYCFVCQPPSAGFGTLFDCVYGCMVNMWNCAIKYSVKFLVSQNFRRNGIFPSLNITCFAFLYVTGAGSRVWESTSYIIEYIYTTHTVPGVCRGVGVRRS